MIVPAVPCREDCPADHIHLPPRRNVAPGSPDWWFAADAPRCAAGECASKEWVISRRNLAARLDFGDFASMFCISNGCQQIRSRGRLGIGQIK